MKDFELDIDGRKIGKKHRPYIIAELSANHNGSIARALETIKSAYDNGADAIKIQTYTADTMTLDCGNDDFMIKAGLWNGYKLYDLYKEAQTPFEWHQVMFDYAKSLGITIFSTPFDETAVDLLESLNVPAYKVASFEATDLPLISYIAKKGKPMIISTGMCSEEEINEAVETARSSGCRKIILLHCISSYPTPIDQANLAQIACLSKNFGVISGLSDHTLGTTAAVAAVALGASVIEKHFTLSRNDKGPDSEFSIEPDELKKLCSETSDTWSAIGIQGFSRPIIEERSKQFRRSIYFAKNLSAGSVLSESDIRRVRPGFGLEPKYFDKLIGKKLKQDVYFGMPTRWDLFDE